MVARTTWFEGPGILKVLEEGKMGRDETRSSIRLPFIRFQQEQLWYWKAAQAFKGHETTPVLDWLMLGTKYLSLPQVNQLYPIG
jgi:sulfate adenylyltransferase subunit 1 (EFTu-like GTPase family)